MARKSLTREQAHEQFIANLREERARADRAIASRCAATLSPRAQAIGFPEHELHRVAEAALEEASRNYSRTKGPFTFYAQRLVFARCEEALRSAGAISTAPSGRDRGAIAPAAGDSGLERLQADHAGLAVNRAMRHRARARAIAMPWDDLLQEARLGLAEAASRYVPEKGPFAPFAIKYIDGRIVAALREAANAPSPVCENDPEATARQEWEKPLVERGVRPGGAPDVEGDSQKLIGEAVGPALRQFSPLEREIIKLCLSGEYWCVEFSESLPITEVAARFHVSPNRVRALLDEFRSEVRRKAGKT
jgi:RNA polymerase sigma factor (sigma-70 family)